MKKALFLFIFCMVNGIYASENKSKEFPLKSSQEKFQTNTANAFGIGTGLNVFIHCSRKSNFTVPHCIGLGIISGFATSTIIKAGLDHYNTTIFSSNIVSENN